MQRIVEKHKRAEMEIYFVLILALAIKGGELPPTRVMYAVNLSWNRLTKILEKLRGRGVITTTRDRITGRGKVILTRLGWDCLQKILELNKILDFAPEALESSSVLIPAVTMNRKTYRFYSAEPLALPAPE
jgi:predicted transcriptional regulator